jgi:hypothetical protein
VGICTDIYRPTLIRPRRVRQAECSAFAEKNRFINFVYSLNLTPDPADNDPASGLGAWSCWDIPAQYAMQDVSTRGDDLLFVAIADRVYLLDWDAFRDQWNWETYGNIYRRLTLGPIPGSREEQEGGDYVLPNLRRFRSFTYQLADPPADDPVTSQYKISVADSGTPDDVAEGYRRTQQNGETKVAKKGYAFLVTLEHEANEDFPLLWWQAEWEELGGRRASDPLVGT